jgi:hypothetical protein
VDALARGQDCIVHNTFIRVWEMLPYLRAARIAGEKATILAVNPGLSAQELAGRCTHGVPVGSIRRMARSWEDFPGTVVVR